jgi:ABC-type dipeptide/oligopeptide/nickel transport system ATPase component
MRFIKFIHKVSKWCHFVVNMYAQNILPCIKIPNLQTRRRHQLTLKLMYTIKHKMLPNYLIDIFTAQVKYMITVQDKANSISRYLSLILI